jgi:hypothetical protein
MATIQLVDLAHARSGRQGGHRQRGGHRLRCPRDYPLLGRPSPERVKAHFGEHGEGRVERFELPNLTR